MKDHNEYFIDATVGTVSGTKDGSEPILYQTQKVEVYDKVKLRTVQGVDVFVAVTAVVPGVSFEGHLMDVYQTSIPTDLDNLSIEKIFVRYPKGAVSN
ncbi:hypothetical protein V9657_004307 [Vibrio vulnificus]